VDLCANEAYAPNNGNQMAKTWRVAQVPGCCEFNHQKRVPQVPRLWAPGIVRQVAHP